MSIYDTILASTQQGYQNLNNQQMQMAQMPTFADKFLAGLRQSQEDEYKRKMAESTLAMNQSYKRAQEEQIRQNAQLHQAQMVGQGAKFVSENLAGQNRASVVNTLRQMGLPESMVPELQYETTPYTYQQETMVPSLPGMSFSEGGEDVGTQTVGGETQTPVEWSDWGTQAAFKQKALDLKEQIAQMSQESKMWLAQHKDMEPKDALAKLIRDWAVSQDNPDPNQRMSARDFNARKFYLTAKANPDVAAWASQGIQVPRWASGAGASSGVPTSVPASSPQAGGTPAGSTSPGGARTSPGNAGGMTIVPTSREGRKMATDQSKVVIAADQALSDVADIRRKARDLFGDDLKSGSLSAWGYLKSFNPKSDASAFESRIESLRGKLMLTAMSLLKTLSASGSTGLGALSNAEGETLKSSIANLKFTGNETAFNRALKEIDDTMDRMETKIKEHRELSVGAAQGVSPADQRSVATPRQSAETPAAPLGKKWQQFNDGKYYLVDK